MKEAKSPKKPLIFYYGVVLAGAIPAALLALAADGLLGLAEKRFAVRR